MLIGPSWLLSGVNRWLDEHVDPYVEYLSGLESFLADGDSMLILGQLAKDIAFQPVGNDGESYVHVLFELW